MTTDMRKTPSYLKGLAETRARVDGDLQRYQKIYDEVGQKLAEARAELAACDRLIRKFDPRLNPERIEPIQAWKGRYGKRGQLKASIKEHLRAQAPLEVSTTELGWVIQLEFGLDFSTWQEKKRWTANSLRNALKDLLEEGLVERLHDVATMPTGEVGRWRWKSDDALSLDHLQAQAEAAGVSVRLCDDVHE